MATTADKIKNIHGAEDIYTFVKSNPGLFIQTRWDHYLSKDSSCSINFHINSVSQIIGCQVYIKKIEP